MRFVPSARVQSSPPPPIPRMCPVCPRLEVHARWCGSGDYEDTYHITWVSTGSRGACDARNSWKTLGNKQTHKLFSMKTCWTTSRTLWSLKGCQFFSYVFPNYSQKLCFITVNLHSIMTYLWSWWARRSLKICALVSVYTRRLELDCITQHKSVCVQYVCVCVQLHTPALTGSTTACSPFCPFSNCLPCNRKNRWKMRFWAHLLRSKWLQ